MKKAVAIVCVFLMSLTLVFANVDNYGVPPYAFDPANGHTAAYIVVQDPANSNEELTLHDFIYNLPLNHTHGFWRRSAGNTLNILYDEGNVGVGGESPTARLTIHHGYGNFLRLNHSPGGLLYTISATGSGFTHSSSSPIQFQSEEDQILRLERQGNGESLGFSRGSEIMRLTSSHRLGFGSGAHNDRMVLTSSGNLELANSLTVGNNTFFDGHVYIRDNKSLFIEGGDIFLADVSRINGSVIPHTGDLFDLGRANKRWNNLYLSNCIDLNGDQVCGDFSRFVNRSEFESNITNITNYLNEEVVKGEGTAGVIPRWTDPETLGDSIMYQGSNIIGITGDLEFTGTLQQGNVPWARLIDHPSIIAGTGLTDGGLLSHSRTLSIDSSYVQRRVTESCNSNQAIRQIFKSGNVECVNVATSSGVQGSGVSGRLARWTNPDTVSDSQIFVDPNGRMGVGAGVDDNYKLFVDGSVLANAYFYASDERLKHDIQTIENPLQTVQQLRGVTFKWNETNQSGVGFIAQEVEQVLPELVGGNDTEFKSVEYANMVALLVEAVKEQQEQIDQLEQQIRELR